MGITAVLNTFNSGQHLDKVLARLHDFDEILVCDMGSSDDTLDICSRHEARIVAYPGGDPGHAAPAREYAIRQALHPWVFVVDPDELVPAALAAYLLGFARNPGDVSGVYIPRKNYIFDREQRHIYPDYQLRFFDKDSVRWPKTLRSEAIVNGKVHKIPSSERHLALIHIPKDMSGILRRLNRHTSVSANESDGCDVSLASIVFRPLWAFMSEYIGHGAFRFGVAGYILAKRRSLHCYGNLAKGYERYRMKGSRAPWLDDTAHAGGDNGADMPQTAKK